MLTRFRLVVRPEFAYLRSSCQQVMCWTAKNTSRIISVLESKCISLNIFDIWNQEMYTKLRHNENDISLTHHDVPKHRRQYVTSNRETKRNGSFLCRGHLHWFSSTAHRGGKRYWHKEWLGDGRDEDTNHANPTIIGSCPYNCLFQNLFCFSR